MSDTRPPARPKFREFHVCVLDDSGMRYTGDGLTLDYVIKEEVEHYRERLEMALGHGSTAGKFAGEEPDRIAWEGFRVLGIFHPRPDGSLDFERIGEDTEATESGPMTEVQDNSGDPCTREELIRHSTRTAIGRYHEAQRWARLSERLDSVEGSHSNPWSVLASLQQCDAEMDLIRTIYCHDPKIHESYIHKCERRWWGPRGVRCEGRLYLAIPNPDDDHDPDDEAESDCWIMRMVIMDPANITDLDAPARIDIFAEAGKVDESPDGASDLDGNELPQLGGRKQQPPTLSEFEDVIVHTARALGEQESRERMFQTGAYGAIRGVMDRLGSDAVDELRRIIAAGSMPTEVAVQAGKVVEGPSVEAMVEQEENAR